jgi:hypothetical protein
VNCPPRGQNRPCRRNGGSNAPKPAAGHPGVCCGALGKRPQIASARRGSLPG